MNSLKVATIDIGSNSLLLTIVSLTGSQVKILVDEARVTGLAKGVMAGGEIQVERLENSLKVMKEYSDLIEKHKPIQVKAVATEALRRASNGESIRRHLETALQHPIELISGDQEAELSFWSVQKEYPNKKSGKLVFDIGGASTELCLGSAHGIQDRFSVKVGSVLVTEKFGLNKPSKTSEAESYVNSLLKDLAWSHGMWDCRVRPGVATPPNALGIGVAGTMTTLLSMELGLSKYQRDAVHMATISKDRVEYWMNEVCSKKLEDRAQIPGLGPERADVMGGGLVIVKSLMDYFSWSEITCMDAGVRWGLIWNYIK